MSKPKIKRFLKSLDVQFISLVDAAANRRQFVYKSDIIADDPDFKTRFNILKMDEEKQLVYGVVYAPDEADTHGDAMIAEELEKAAHQFLEKARTKSVDVNHDSNPDDGVIVESYILGKNDSRFPGEKEGSWAVVIKVTDADTWELVKKGDLKGISMAGKAEAELVEAQKSEESKAQENFMSKFFDTFKRMFGEETEQEIAKDFNGRVAVKEIRSGFWALEEEFNSIMYSEDIEDKKAAILKAIGQFEQYVTKLELPTQTTTKNDKDMNTEKTATEEAPKEAAVEKTDAAAEEQTAEQQVKTLEKSVADLTKKIEELEKSAPGRQSKDDGKTVEKSDEEKRNPKAPLKIFG